MIDLELLNKKFVLNAETGDLIWRHNGKIAGCEDGAYKIVRFDGKYRYVQRLVWALYNNQQPPARITFRNGDSLDTRPCNLVEWKSLKSAS